MSTDTARSAAPGSASPDPTVFGQAGADTAVLEIDLAAIVANWRTLTARHTSGPVAAVVKGDGYGLGAGPIAAALHAAGCRHFFVAYLNEALALRDVVPGAMLAVLSGLVPGTEYEYVAHGLTPVLGSLDEITRWSRHVSAGRGHGSAMTPRGQGPAMTPRGQGPAMTPRGQGPAMTPRGQGPAMTPRGPVQAAILHVDTGMSRLGLDARELAVLAADHTRLDGLAISHVMTHLVASEVQDDPINALQLARFAAARAMLPPMPASLANSSGIFLGPAFGSDLARAGAALYGINPTPEQPNPMCGVVRLSIRVLAVRDVAEGATVGYNATWTAARPSRIATAALGYADGFHRSLSGRGAACFDGTPVPLVGRVSMDLTTFDVTDHPEVQPGFWLEVLGPHLPPDDVARAAGTNGYEVLTSLGRRFHRMYRTA
jgi:alanine racemase